MARHGKDDALTRMAGALARGETDVFAHALADALRAGATREEVDAWMKTVSHATRPSRLPFDPFELSEVFTALPGDP